MLKIREIPKLPAKIGEMVGSVELAYDIIELIDYELEEYITGKINITVKATSHYTNLYSYGLTYKQCFCVFERIKNGKKFKDIAQELEISFNGARDGYIRGIRNMEKFLGGC